MQSHYQKLIMFLIILSPQFLPEVGHTQSVSKIDGVIYSDYYYNLKNSVASEKDRNAFQYRRIYFTFENNITSAIKFRFRLESESNSYGSTAKINPFVKHAFLEWGKLIPQHTLQFGITETNAFKNSEEYWGYRSIEKTIMDLNKISSSADFGVALKGDLFGNKLHHWLTVMNGTGYGAAEGDRYKKVGYSLWLTPIPGLILEGYGDYENQGASDIQTATPLSTAKDYTLASSYYTVKSFVGYSQPKYTVGVDVFQRVNSGSGLKNIVTQQDNLTNKYKIISSEQADVTRFGYSIFASAITPINGLKVFARYDYFDNNTGNSVFTKFDESKGTLTSGKDDETTMIFAGLDYIPVGNIHIMPNVIVKNYAKSGLDSDVTLRLTLYCKYDSGKISVE